MDNSTGASTSKKRKCDKDEVENRVGYLAKHKLEENRKILENQLKNDPFVMWPEVAVRDYLCKYLDTEAKINVSRVSPYVKRLMGTKNATWMLSDALSVPHLYKTISYYHADGKRTNWHDVINIHRLKDLRLVCRDWRWSVDNYYKTAYGNLPNYSDFNSLILTTTSRTWYDKRWDTYFDAEDEKDYGKPYFFKSSEKPIIQEFLRRFAGNNRCPIITKSIHIYLQPGAMFLSEINDEDVGLYTLLDKYGKDILCAEVAQWAPKSEKTSDVVNQFHRVLQKMPNLVYLHFKNDTVAIKDMGKAPSSAPFPPLPNLKVLVIYNRKRIRESTFCFFSPMNNYFDQIHTLVVQRTALLHCYDPTIHSKFPSLQRLSILVEDKEQLVKLRGWTSPLKEVILRSTFNGTLELYLHGLESFWKTLCAIDAIVIESDNDLVWMHNLNLQAPAVFPLHQLKILVLDGLNVDEANHTIRKLSNPLNFCRFV